MKVLFSTVLAVVLASSSSADASTFDFLRGGSSSSSHTAESHLEQFACTMAGSTDQDTCDATKSEDGSKCVWCDIASFGVCVSEQVAEKMKEQIPGLQCDDDDNTDDDKAPDDDKTPSADDDTKPNDDAVNPDYWNCLEKNDDEKSCTDAGCVWCDTKGGFGICMDKDAAADEDGSDWYTCKKSEATSTTKASGGFLEFFFGTSDNEENEKQTVSDPTDPSCLLVTLQGDESQCKQTSDADGNPCEWCSVSSYELCLNADQAAIAEQAGGSCNDAKVEDNQEEEVEDPYDPTCLGVTIGGDESTCKQTLDSDGNACEWCTVGTTDLCVNAEQAAFAQQLGGSCEETSVDVKDDMVEDPYDPSCLLVNIQGADEDTCHQTEDSEGNKCQWCTVGTTSLCVNGDQAAAAEQLSGTCEEAKKRTTNGSAFSLW